VHTLANLFRKSNRAKEAQPIVVVSGLPRSGTSMMMAMLEAGGLPPLTDKIRTPDDDNPRGYYEFERVKQLDKGDTGWLSEAEGKAVKVISALLTHLPATGSYRVLFMRRQMEEILESQRAMLLRRGQSADPKGDTEVEALMAAHVAQVRRWLDQQPNIRTLEVDYNQTLTDGAAAARQINAFLGGWLDEARMADVVDRKLYRNRGQTN
jgi:hypothetical protein